MSVRFSVRDDLGRRSAMWSLFTMGNNVGVTTLEVSGAMKVNLHESGSWQIGYTSEFEKRAREAGKWKGDSRHWEIWNRPAPVKPGYTAALKILVPSPALHERSAPKKPGKVRWVDARNERAVSFTIWLSKSTIPPWGYGGENEILGTLPLPNGEYVLLGAHYVPLEDANRVMMRGLSGFVRLIAATDTSDMKPIPPGSTLMGLAPEPTGLRAITEIALWSLTSADAAPRGEPAEAVSVSADPTSSGLFDVEIPLPRSIFAEQGVDPKTDLEAARAIAAEYNSTKLREIRRVLGLPSDAQLIAKLHWAAAV